MAREIAQRIIMTTGKGGVGKSTVAAARAHYEAHQGARTLLVELGERSQLSYIFKKPVSYMPSQLAPNLWVALWSGETCLKEYLKHLVKIQKIADLFFDNRVMKSFV